MMTLVFAVGILCGVAAASGFWSAKLRREREYNMRRAIARRLEFKR